MIKKKEKVKINRARRIPKFSEFGPGRSKKGGID
jgi:hypothetical protein